MLKKNELIQINTRQIKFIPCNLKHIINRLRNVYLLIFIINYRYLLILIGKQIIISLKKFQYVRVVCLCFFFIN